MATGVLVWVVVVIQTRFRGLRSGLYVLYGGMGRVYLGEAIRL